MANKGWVGVDLDGTLAHYDGWRGIEHIGKPVELMVERVKDWLAKGRDVKIFTARVYLPENPSDDQLHDNAHAVQYIDAWCVKTFGHTLPITCVKDMKMVELWDDRAVRVKLNTGEPCCGG